MKWRGRHRALKRRARRELFRHIREVNEQGSEALVLVVPVERSLLQTPQSLKQRTATVNLVGGIADRLARHMVLQRIPFTPTPEERLNPLSS